LAQLAERGKAKPSCRLQRQLGFLDPPSRKGQCLINVLRFQIGVKAKGLGLGVPDSEQSNNRSHRDPKPSKARFPPITAGSKVTRVNVLIVDDCYVSVKARKEQIVRSAQDGIQ
jgi:hypothetical protein